MSKNTQPNRVPYSITIRKHNEAVHQDIEKDLARIKNGYFIFTLRVNDGNIIDYTVLEHCGY